MRVKWNMNENAPNVSGGNYTLQFTWVYTLEDPTFAASRKDSAGIFLISNAGTTEAGSGAYTQQFSFDPFSVTRGGITSLGTFYVGRFSLISTAVKESDENILKVFGLCQNYPNPFNPTTVISYQLPINSFVTLKVYDVVGREVKTLVNGPKNAGNYAVNFDASILPSGVYFYRINADEFTEVKRLVLMK